MFLTDSSALKKLFTLGEFTKQVRRVPVRQDPTSWSQHHFDAIGNPERHVRNASHRGSKQQ